MIMKMAKNFLMIAGLIVIAAISLQCITIKIEIKNEKLNPVLKEGFKIRIE